MEEVKIKKMKKVKNAIIAALVCVNVGLLGWLVLSSLPQAYGQTIGGASDYILLTGRTRTADAVYVVDLRNRRMASWLFDQKTRQIVQIRGRDLTVDYKNRK